ncbi:unnamed protein product [Lactuca saligna]|uniref:SWIM-type domain-containing protein n=1 Tax=Lactuca saligna TaxID=75948 RepID=A0AA35YZY0_LACSI|nr:unnamed protein product [Lactuca saligna]
MTEDADTIVDVHYNGMFTPTLLMYFDGVKASVPYMIVNKTNFLDFIPFLEKLTNGRCRDVYYCLHEEEETDLEDDDLVSIDDVDSILEDGLKVEHVEDDEVISLKRNFNDQFLNKLCPIQNDDLVEEDHNAIRPIYPRHDHTQEWNEMKPRLGMKYSTTAELKYSLSCYVVANGHDLWNAKKLALSEVEGSLKEHYAKLWDYAPEIRRANPGVVDGWLDGCRKSNFENKRTWKWFLDNLMEEIGGGNGHDITILSYGHKKETSDNNVGGHKMLGNAEVMDAEEKRFELGFGHMPKYQNGDRGFERIAKRSCGCRSWQLTCIPCVHAISTISSLNLDVEAFVSNSYTKASLLSSYKYNIHPLNDSSECPHVEGLHTILPPLRRRVPGKPCVKMKRDQTETELSGHTRDTVPRACIPIRCTICHQTSHNKATCPSKPTPTPSTTGQS